MKHKQKEKSLNELIEEYDQTYKVDMIFTPPKEQLIDDKMKNRIQRIIRRMQDMCPYCKRYPSNPNCEHCHGEAGQEIDWIFVICGAEGSGKSTLAAAILWEYCSMVGLSFEKLSKDNIVFDDFDLIRTITKLDETKKMQFLFVDEGNNAFLNRESMTQTRTMAIKLLNTMRFKRFFTVLCSVDISQLDIVLREHRIKALIRIEKPGVYHYYDRKRLAKLYYVNEKRRTLTWDWGNVIPCFMGNYKFSPEIKQLIEQLKVNYIRRFKLEASRTYYRELKKRLSVLPKLEQQPDTSLQNL